MSVKELRDDYRSRKAALQYEITSSGSSTRGVSTTLHRLALLADETLLTLWEQAGLAGPFALVAVGGFGRAELLPHSDVDVLVLLPDDRAHEGDAELRSRIEAFIGSCWDAGLEIGSSVRTVSQCLAEAEKDVTVQTSMLESRLVTGDSRLFGRLREFLRLAMDPQAFFVAKTLEMHQRHSKFEDTPYALEPNCKESPGGLRDLQVILWVAKAAGFGKNWDELARKGLATAFEIKQIKRNEALLRLIRARLHLLAGRREDRLVFDLQTAVAESFGYVAPTLVAARTALPPEGAVPPWGGPAAERAPTLVAARTALPPEGAVPPWGGPAAERAPTLVAARTALPPEGAVPPWGGPAAERAPTLVAARTALPPEGAVPPWGSPAAERAPTLVAARTALPPEGAHFALGRTGGETIAPTLIAARTALSAAATEPRLMVLAAAEGTPTDHAIVPPSAAATQTQVTDVSQIALLPLPRVTMVRSSEALMRRYYWAAKAVSQLNQILLLNIEERLYPSAHEPRPLNARFNEKAGMIDVASDDLYQREPHAILETFLLYQTTVGIKGLSSRTLRALYNARSAMNGAFRNDPVNRDTFRKILMQHDGLTHAMRLMNQTSVLGRYLWVFRRIVGQMQHDLFHVYTVDQHILMVLRNVRRFFIVEHAHEYPFCSQLAAGWDKPWLLYVAALFHDIAKGRRGDHSTLGALEVRRFSRQHRIDREDARMIEFLVREHLSMSHTAQKADLSDPDVIRAFAARVGTERHLTALYLLTVADIRGTSPKVWNAWKGKLLEDLYRLTVRVLGGAAPDPDAEVEARKREALVMIALYALPFEAHKPLWNTLDVGYFMRHDASDIAWHTRHLSRHLGSEKPIVRARRSPVGEGLQVLVYTRDKSDLFARICGYFDNGGFSILDARVHTARNGYALDTFQIVTSSPPEQYRELTSMVENRLATAIADTGPLRQPSRGRVSRRVKSFPITPRVTLRPDEKAQRWLLNITASDRVGLLYSVARVLAAHHINLQLAKVATLGERVDDTFLIDGAQLQHNRAQIAVETELLRALA